MNPIKSHTRLLAVFMLLFTLVMALPWTISAQGGSVEANKAFVQRYYDEFWAGRNLTLSEEFMADDFTAHFPSGPMTSEVYISAVVEPTLANFADFFTDAYVMIAEDDLVAVLDHWGGTSAASGHEAHVAGIDIYRIENGKLGDFYLLYSTLSWSQQLGNVPSEEEVPLEQPWDVELGATSSTPDEHKLVLIRLLEATNEANVDLLDEVYTDDAVIHQVSSRTQLDGLEAIKESWSAYLAENPEYRMASGYVIAEGDLVVMHGDIFNALENGERYRVYVGMLFRFEDGRIAEQWEIWDAQTLFQLSAE